jgi:ATP-dependent Clp protease ATP-binding subunit ClpA
MLNLFLQAFDEGWITDGRGKRVYLSDSIVIMTSNAGTEHFRKLTSPLGFCSGATGLDQVKGEVAKELERRFSPEFRNRIDEVVLFTPLSQTDVRAIAEIELAKVADTLEQAGKRLVIEPDAVDQIVKEGYSLAYGARFLKRIIDDKVKLPISEFWQGGPEFRVLCEDGKVIVESSGMRLLKGAAVA